MPTIADRLRAIQEPKARGRLRVAEVVSAHRNSGLSWVGANGWKFVLDFPPDIYLSPKDSNRAATRFDLTVSDGTLVIFRDRILAWDGTPILVPDGVDTFREDIVLGARMDIEHTVRAVTKNGTRVHVKAKPGTVSTVFATAPGGDGFVSSNRNAYATARTGGTLATADNHIVGQEKAVGPIFWCWESFLLFDTSGIPDADNVTAVTASLDGNANSSTTDFNAKIAASSYNGGVVVSTDWVDGSTLSALTVLASWASSGYSADYNDFTETADFKTAINKTGSTALIVFSDRHAAGTEPTDAEYVTFNDADAAGTTTDPKLVITHGSVGSPYYAYAQQ